jgi:hypothetical protein
VIPAVVPVVRVYDAALFDDTSGRDRCVHQIAGWDPRPSDVSTLALDAPPRDRLPVRLWFRRGFPVMLKW